MIPNPKFAAIAKKLTEYLQRLNDCHLTEYDDVDGLCDNLCPSNKGVYVFYENNYPMYVGRSDRLKVRIREQMNLNSPPSKSACAVEIAKKFAVVCLKRMYPECRNISEKALRNRLQRALREEFEFRELFNRYFADAKERVEVMGVRVVKITDPNEQSIFEICAHLALETPYNNFRNH